MFATKPSEPHINFIQFFICWSNELSNGKERKGKYSKFLHDAQSNTIEKSTFRSQARVFSCFCSIFDLLLFIFSVENVAMSQRCKSCLRSGVAYCTVALPEIEIATRMSNIESRNRVDLTYCQ